MNKTNISNADIALMMKAALEYNAHVLHVATAFYGNMDNAKAQKSLYKNMRELSDAYVKQLESIYNVYDQDNIS